MIMMTMVMNMTSMLMNTVMSMMNMTSMLMNTVMNMTNTMITTMDMRMVNTTSIFGLILRLQKLSLRL